MDSIPPMEAIFSTHLGQYQPRPAFRGPIVLRSSPDEDQDSMIAKLRQRFPLECKAITAPVTNIHYWFDHHDAYRHGYGFLHSVLTTIAFQNSREVHDFAERWRTENQERFYGVARKSGIMFTGADIAEHGSAFLAEAAQHIHYLRSSVPYGARKFADPSRDRRVESYLGGGGPVAHHDSRQSRYNSPIRQFTTKKPPMPQGGHMWNPKTPMNQMLNYSPDFTSAQIPIHISTQVPVRDPRPHPSARRVEFHSDSEEYTYRHHAIPSQEAPEIPYRRVPLSARLPQPRYPSAEIAPVDPGTRRVFSNDARVLELQELRSRSGYSGNDMVDFATAQQPVPVPSQFRQGPAETQDRTHSTSTRLINSSLKNDPAVVFVGEKARNDEYQSYLLSKQGIDHFQRGFEQHASGLSRENLPWRQWSDSSTGITGDENDQASSNPHVAVENRQAFQSQYDRNSSALKQYSKISTRQSQSSPIGLVTPYPEQRPFPDQEHWPVEAERSGRKPCQNHDERKIFIKNIPANFSKPWIRGLFDPSSSIVEVSNVMISSQRDSRGYAFVTFEKASDAAHAVKTLDSTAPASCGGRRLVVKHAFNNSIQHGQRRPEVSCRSDALGSANDERPRMVDSENHPENLIDQVRVPDSDALISGNGDQFCETDAARESPDKASSQFLNSVDLNEKRRSKKVSVSSSRSGHSNKRSVQRIRHDSSATDLSLNTKAERDTKPKHEAKPNQNRIANTGSTKSGGTTADALVMQIQTTPALDPEQFPPLVASRSVELGNAKEPQVKPRKKEVKPKGKKPPASQSGKLDREQDSSSIEMVRGESGSTAEGVLETSSALVTQPTSDAHSEPSTCDMKEAQVPNSATETSPTLKSFTKTGSGVIQPVTEPGSSEIDHPKVSMRYGKAQVIRTGIDPSHTVPLSMNVASASDLVAKSETKEPEKVSPVISIAPEKSVTHDSMSARDAPSVITTQTQPRNDQSSVTPTKKSKSSRVKTSPATRSTASNQISSALLPEASKDVALESHRPEVPLRTSSLTTPSNPILTHKKKQKVFTTSKVDIKDLSKDLSKDFSGEIDQECQPKVSTDLTPIRNIEQDKTEQAPKSNASEALKKNLEANNEEPANLRKAPLPSTEPVPKPVSEPEEGNPSKEQADTTQRPATSARNLPKKPKRKRAGKKQRSRCKVYHSTSAIGNETETAVNSGSEKPQAPKNLPKPETPYLLDNQYILPQATIKSSQATKNENNVIVVSKTQAAADLLDAIRNQQIEEFTSCDTFEESSQATKNENTVLVVSKTPAAADLLQAIRNQQIEEFTSCDTFEEYAHVKGCNYEPYAAYFQNNATFSTIQSSRLLTSDDSGDDIQPLPHSAGYPKPPGVAQPFAWADQGPQKLRSWDYVDETGAFLILDCYETHLESALNESKSNRKKGKARTDSPQSSDGDTEVLGNPDDSDHLPRRNLNGGGLSSDTDTAIDSQTVSAGVQGLSLAPEQPSKKFTQVSDLPFRQRFPNLDSSPRAKSTMAVLTSSFSPPSSLPFLVIAGDDPLKKGAVGHQITEFTTTLTKPVTPCEGGSSVTKNPLSTVGTTGYEQNIGLLNSTHDDLILDLAIKTPIPSKPKSRERKGHQRGVSHGSVSSSSTPRTPVSATISSLGDSQHLSEAFAAISDRNAAEFAARLKVARSEAPISPPRTPTHGLRPSYAAAALSPTKGSPPISNGEVIQVGGAAVGWHTASWLASEDQAFVDLIDGIGVGLFAKGAMETNSKNVDPWRVPRGETVWGSGSGDP